MASNKILGHVIGVSHSTASADEICDFIIQWYVTGASVTGPISGFGVFTADASLNDAQISLALRTALAAYLDPLILPTQNFAANDVRGCSV